MKYILSLIVTTIFVSIFPAHLLQNEAVEASISQAPPTVEEKILKSCLQKEGWTIISLLYKWNYINTTNAGIFNKKPYWGSIVVWEKCHIYETNTTANHRYTNH